MGQVAVSQQVDGAAEVLVNPFHGDLRVGVIVECLVDAGDGLHRLQDGTDVVTHQDNGTAPVDVLQ